MTWRGRCKVLLWMLCVSMADDKVRRDAFFVTACDELGVSEKTLRGWAKAWGSLSEEGPFLKPADRAGTPGADEPVSGYDLWGKPLEWFRPEGGAS